MKEYTLFDRLTYEYKEITEEEAMKITQPADLYTGPMGGMGRYIDIVLYCLDDSDKENETIEILAVKHAGEWLCIPSGQNAYMSFELGDSGHE